MIIYGVCNGVGNLDDLFDSMIYGDVAGNSVPIGFGRGLDLADDEMVEKVFRYKIALNVSWKTYEGKDVFSNTN